MNFTFLLKVIFLVSQIFRVVFFLQFQLKLDWFWTGRRQGKTRRIIMDSYKSLPPDRREEFEIYAQNILKHSRLFILYKTIKVHCSRAYTGICSGGGEWICFSRGGGLVLIAPQPCSLCLLSALKTLSSRGFRNFELIPATCVFQLKFDLLNKFFFAFSISTF